uniref:Uncharacterized protein LOC105640921 isoform X2 n=1 Tax=Rhizophora mucronata TaxID=61149 RepID=A0A2P2JPL9_RHIMU
MSLEQKWTTNNTKLLCVHSSLFPCLLTHLSTDEMSEGSPCIYILRHQIEKVISIVLNLKSAKITNSILHLTSSNT